MPARISAEWTHRCLWDNLKVASSLLRPPQPKCSILAPTCSALPELLCNEWSLSAAVGRQLDKQHSNHPITLTSQLHMSHPGTHLNSIPARCREPTKGLTRMVFLKLLGSAGSSKGYAPTSMTYRVTPHDHTSAISPSYRFLLITSGAA